MGCRYSSVSYLFGATMIFICLCGCAKPLKTDPTPTQSAGIQCKGSVNSPSIQTILEKSPDLAGEVITLQGVFKGWKGNCKTPPPVSRSDWMVQDATGCIYVNGPIPDGLRISGPDNEPVSVKGVLRLIKGGPPYLELIP